MKRGASYLGGAAAVLLLVAVSGWLFCLSKINFDYTVMRINFVWLCLGALFAYAVNCVLLRRGVPVPLFACVQVLLAAGAAFLFTRSVHLEPMKLRTMIIVGTVYTLSIPGTAFAAYESPRKNALLLCFDISAILLAILLLLDHVLFLPALPRCAGMCLASLCAALLALVAERAGRLSGNTESVAGNRWAGRALLAVCFAAVLGLAAAVAAVASVGIRRAAEACVAALQWLWAQILAGLRWCYRLLERFLLWLSQFSDDVPTEAGGEIPAMSGMEESEYLQEMSLRLPWWFYAILGVLVLALLAWIVWKLRKLRFGRIGPGSVRRAAVTERESAAGSALRELWEQLKNALRYRVNCVRKRKTAPGLLAWCEKRAPKAEARRAGESGESFLRRLGEARNAPALGELAELVERGFYAPTPAPVPAELYRHIRRMKFT